MRVDYSGVEDEPIIAATGYASSVMQYDHLNRLVKIDYLGKEGQLIKMLNGYARITYEYWDDTDREHYVRYFGADGNRTMITEGYSMVEKEYEGGDFDYRETYYDFLDEYTMSNAGHARIEYKYHPVKIVGEDGREKWVIRPDMVEWERYFGTDLRLIERKAGFAGYVNERNEYHQVIRTTYMDDQWQPVRNDETQYASIEFKYEGTDPKEPAVYESYFDQAGVPCESITGAYARSMVNGGPKKNLLLEEEFFTADGQPDTNVVHGAHKVVYNFDGNLLQTSARYYNQDGTAKETRTGMATLLREYNRNGSLLWEATFDSQNHLVNASGQSAVQVHTYDYAGHLTGDKFFDAEGNALVQGAGYASVTYEYDNLGNITAINYFNAADEPAMVAGRSRVVREYDDQHHMLYEAYFGPDMQPIVISEGYAARRIAYDPLNGIASRVDYLGIEGKPELLPAGYASYELKYDGEGNLLRRAYYDENGAPVTPASVGYSWFERQLDAQGRVTEEAYYDADGSLLVNPDKYAVITMAYDDAGKTTVTYLDADRLPVVNVLHEVS